MLPAAPKATAYAQSHRAASSRANARASTASTRCIGQRSAPSPAASTHKGRAQHSRQFQSPHSCVPNATAAPPLLRRFASSPPRCLASSPTNSKKRRGPGHVSIQSPRRGFISPQGISFIDSVYPGSTWSANRQQKSSHQSVCFPKVSTCPRPRTGPRSGHPLGPRSRGRSNRRSASRPRALPARRRPAP